MKPHEKHTFRPGHANDFEFVRRLHHETRRPYIEQIWGWDKHAQDRAVEKWFKPHRIQIIRFGCEDVGLLVLEKLDEFVSLESISITGRYQGLGLGGAIIRKVLEDAAALGLPVTLQVLRPNPARRLYERLGFRIVGQSETHFQMRWASAGSFA